MLLSASVVLQTSRRVTTDAERISRRFGRVVRGTGIAWPALAVAFALAALALPWFSVPLIRSYSLWAIPVDLGWGVRIGFVSYGLMMAIIVLTTSGRALLALDWRMTRFGRRLGVRPRPLTHRTLIGIGIALLAPLPMLIYQVTLADFNLAAAFAGQENQSLLIQEHLGYQIAAQHFPMQPFQIAIATPGERLYLLAQLADLTVFFPIVAALLCWYGAYHLRRSRAITLRAALYAVPPRPISRTRRRLWVGVAVFGVIVLGRAPLALLCEQLGVQATAAGAYGAAVADFGLAQVLNPSLANLLSFHEERGKALAPSHSDATLDVALYRAAQDRAAGSPDQAWHEDQQAQRHSGNDAALRQDMVLTLEMLVEQHANHGLSGADRKALRQAPLAPLYNAGTIVPAADQTLPWLDQLIAVQPTGRSGAGEVYAHYMRGYILFLNHDYDLAASDFRATLRLAGDADMDSASYTYQALCAGATGNYAQERDLLQKAVGLDHGYYNTIARETASGLH
jgi:tetratricopeptide (TPR) repeat protein